MFVFGALSRSLHQHRATLGLKCQLEFSTGLHFLFLQLRLHLLVVRIGRNRSSSQFRESQFSFSTSFVALTAARYQRSPCRRASTTYLPG